MDGENSLVAQLHLRCLALSRVGPHRVDQPPARHSFTYHDICEKNPQILEDLLNGWVRIQLGAGGEGGTVDGYGWVGAFRPDF